MGVPLFPDQMRYVVGELVMTANSRKGLPEPLQSRCLVLDLADLTIDQLRYFAQTEGTRRCLPDAAMAALMDVFDCLAIKDAGLSLRTVSRTLDRSQMLVCKPIEPRRVCRRLICLSYAAISDLSRAA